MALAARALVRASQDNHRKRVLGRYVFVYLHDVVRFGAAWRNAVRRRKGLGPAADAALPALDRLRRDWDQYQDVRHYIGAKRQPRDPTNPEVDELESFRLWANIGELAIDTLTSDAVELYVQLASVTTLAPIDYEPTCPAGVVAALDQLDPLGEEGLLEATATSFGADKGTAVTIRMGGDAGRLVPLINDVAESLQTLQALAPVVREHTAFDRFLRCQLPAELDELLRLSIGSPIAGTEESPSLITIYSEPDAPPETIKALKEFRAAISQETRISLRDWRNRLGAHIDDDGAWSELEEGITALDIEAVMTLSDTTLLWIEVAACTRGGPLPLLFPARKLNGFKLTADQIRPPLSYVDLEADEKVGELPSARPPASLDSPFMVWVGGSHGQYLSAAVAGMAAGRGRELNDRLKKHNARQRGSGRRRVASK